MHKTLNDLLEIAIENEISSQKLYSDAYNLVSDEKAKVFLNELVEEEKGHQTMLESIKEMELYDGSIPIEDPSILESGKSSHEIKHDFSESSKIEDILEIALKREFRAKTIFEKMADITTNDELRTMFNKLAEEEQIHHQNITKKFRLRQGEMGYEM